jgi:protein phosphatase
VFKKSGKPAGITWVGQTHNGRKYTTNEDFYILPEPDERYGVTAEAVRERGHLFVLCDGMGGARSGEVASELTAGWMVREFYTGEWTGSDILSVLAGATLSINTRIFDLAAKYDQYSGMGTTLVAAHVAGGGLSLCTVGDSRAYLFRDGRLVQLTDDHSEVWSLYASNIISKEDMRTHPRKHVLTRAIGITDTLRPDELFLSDEKLNPGDLVLLCSDGLSDMVGDDPVRSILSARKSLQDKADALVAAANDNGGKDNITVILVSI